MGKGTKPIRWITMLLAVVALATACGDDGGSDSATDDSAASADTSPDDAPVDDDMTDDATGGGPDSDDGGSDDGGSDDGGSGDTPSPGTSVDCAEIQAAIDAAADLSAIDPTGASGAEDLEASFEQSRASLAALGESAPEIADEVDKALAGYDELGAIFAELDWNLDFSSNPAGVAQIAGAMNDADILGMASAMQAISTWITTTCTS